MQEIKELVYQLGSNNSNEICKDIASMLMCQYQLNIENNIFDITELEFYFFSDSHPDPYVHKNLKQLEFGTFYVHPKDGNYGGIDIAIGDKNKNIYGGALIRGLRSQNGDFFSGPNIIKKEIYRILNVMNYQDLQNIIDDKISFVNKYNPNKIAYSTRIGLKPKFEDYLNDGKYIYKLYRFITYTDDKQHKYQEKKNVKLYNQDNKTLERNI